MSEKSSILEIVERVPEAGYTQAKWKELLDDAIAKIHKLSKEKGGEYAGDTDRLANFRRNAERLGLSMDQVWAVYASKHWDAVMQHIQDIATGRFRTVAEPIEERVDDLLVYLLLYKAILDERS